MKGGLISALTTHFDRDTCMLITHHVEILFSMGNIVCLSRLLVHGRLLKGETFVDYSEMNEHVF